MRWQPHYSPFQSLGTFLRPRDEGEMRADLAWVSLGQITQFPEGETRLATYRNPLVRPSDGETANIPCWVRHISANNGRSLPSTALISVALCDGFRSRASSCARVMAAHIMPMGRALPAHRLAACSEYDYKVENGELLIKAGQVPTLAQPPSVASADKSRRCTCA